MPDRAQSTINVTKPITLLLIESDAAQIHAMQGVFAAHQAVWQLTAVNSLSLGSQALAHGVFDAVLVRYEIGGGTAFGLLPALSGQTVLLLVAPGQEWAAAQGMRHGFGDYLVTVGLPNPECFKDLPAQVLAVQHRFETARVMRENQQRYELAVEGFDLVPWDRNVVLGTIDGSEALKAMLGYGPEDDEWTYDRWKDRIHPDDRYHAQSAIKAYLAGQTPNYECEYRVRHTAGHWIWLLSRGAVVARDEMGAPTRLVGAFMDISSSRVAQEAATQQHNLLLAISRAQAAFIGSESNASVFEGVLAAVLLATDSAYGFVAEVLYDDANQAYLKIQALTDISWDDASRAFMTQGNAGGIEFHNTATLFGAALLTGEPVIANHPASDPRSGGLPPGHPPMHSFLGIPIHYAGTMVAMLALANRASGYKVAQIEFLNPLCQTIGQLVHARRIDLARAKAVAALHAATEQLVQKTRALETTLDNMDQGIAMTNADDQIGVYNRRWLELLDLPESLMATNPTQTNVFEFQKARGDFGDGLKLVEDRARQYLNQGGSVAGWPAKYLRNTHDGRVLEVATRAVPTGGIVRMFADVTTEHTVAKALQERLGFIEKITSRAPGLVMQLRLRPNGQMSFPYASEAFASIYGVDPKTVVDDAGTLIALHHPDDYPAVLQSIAQSAKTMTPWRHEYRLKLGDGTIRWLYANAVPEAEADGSVLWCGFITDITERKNSEQQIERLAFFDELTNLPNRRMLMDRLQTAVRSSARHKLAGALLFIDLDNFKDLNDTQGHDVGDQLLQQVATRLGRCVRAVDTVARLGGDEFVVMLEELSADVGEASAQADTVARKILATLNQPYYFNGQMHHSTPSIGVTLFFDHHHSVEDLLKRADLAMYQAKAAGRNSLCFFEASMQAVVTRRTELEAELRLGLARDELRVYYQPVVDVAGTMTGVEALVRWQHPQRGLVPPIDFIALAEQTGLIVPLGQWVLQAVCHQLVAWAAQPATRGLSIAVNVSARQFRHDHFVPQVRGLLQSTGANPRCLKLELTESMLLTDVEDVIRTMVDLKSLGVSFSLDDFGTGYSSLSYLKRLPLDQLKIDQSFVREVLTSPNDAAIARAILSLAHSLDLHVVAEGVELQAQRDFLVQCGCTAFQGYYFGRPVPIDKLLMPLPQTAPVNKSSA